MNLTFTVLTIGFTQLAVAQKNDTTWYNSKWEKTTELSARHYFRVVEKLDAGKYKVADYYETGAKQMEGFFLSIDPEIKDGEFKYWYRSGKMQMNTIFEDNKQMQVCQYNEAGDVINEWELVPVVITIGGKTKTEYRVLQRSPKFPGGKEAMADFISKNIKKSVGTLGDKGEVVIQFEIDVEGKAVKPIILRGLSEEHNKQAINVIKKMPEWEPALQDGKRVAITLSLPIKFN